MATRATEGAGDSPQLAAAALRLAEEGFDVFPCGADKSPLTAHGFHDASADVEVVAKMSWGSAGTIGVAVPEGIAVVDVDPRNGGDETLTAAKGDNKFPATTVVATGSGGRHYWFKTREELKASLGPGVDVKRAGLGYVVVPPSPGYRYLRRDDPAALPEWLAEKLRAPAKEHAAGAAASPKFAPFEAGTAYGIGAMDRELGRLARAQPGGRNEELNKASFALAQLVAGGELDVGVQGMLESVAAQIGLASKEIRSTLTSGWEAGLADPRQAPPLTEGATSNDDARPTAGVGGPLPSVSEDDERFWLDWNVEEAAPEYLVRPIIPRNAYVLVFGATEASKSMVFTALGAEASRRGERVTVYSLENPPHVERDRLRRLNPDPDNFRMSTTPLNLHDRAQFEALLEREQAWATDLIIIDTYSHAFESRSEDGNAKAINFAKHVRYLMHHIGCSVVVVDHTGYERDDSPRDASAKLQQVDVAPLMRKVGEWHPGESARFSMENRKTARFGNPFDFEGEIRGKTGAPLDIHWARGKLEWARG